MTHNLPASAGAVSLFLADRFGGLIIPEETDVTVGLTPVRMIGYSDERMSLTLCNTGANDIYIGGRSTVGVTTGIRVPAGAALSMNVNEDGILPAIEWWGVSAVAGITVHLIAVQRDLGYRPPSS